MTTIAMSVTGVEALDRKLRAMPTKIRNRVLRQAVKAGADLVADRARELVPVDTGDLQRSIKVRAGMYRDRKFIRRPRGVVARSVIIGPGFFRGDQFYGGMIEFGTRKMSARPFMRPAYAQTRDAVSRMLIARIKAGIEAEGRR